MATAAAATATATATATCSLSKSHPNFPSLSKPKPISCYFPYASSPPLISSLTLSKLHPFHFKITQNPINQTLIIPPRKPRNFTASASSVDQNLVPSAISADSAQDIVSATSADDGVYNIISILLFIAFIGLSVLTIGVVYIAVTDFLLKREKEKFEKEEAVKKRKKGGKKVKARARTGPKGFGQKIDEEDDDD